MKDLVSKIDDSYVKDVHNQNMKRDVLRWMAFIEQNAPLVFDHKRVLGVYRSINDGLDPIQTALATQGVPSKYVGINYKDKDLPNEMRNIGAPPVKGNPYHHSFDTILLSLASEEPFKREYVHALADVLWSDGVLVVSRSMKNHKKVKNPELEDETFKTAGLTVVEGHVQSIPALPYCGGDQIIRLSAVTAPNGRTEQEKERYHCTHVYRFYFKG